MLRVAVIGGGPSGSCADEILAKAGIKTWIFERKLDNAKPCGGAIPLCMVSEFDLPDSIIELYNQNKKTLEFWNDDSDIGVIKQSKIVTPHIAPNTPKNNYNLFS